ncbi:hypothetical protein ACVIN2_002915 [Bradyrhizobium sp. USDA 3650]
MIGHGVALRRERSRTCSPTAAPPRRSADNWPVFRHFAGGRLWALKALARDRGGAIQLIFCLAHARRKFVEVFKTTQSPFAREVIKRLQTVYAIQDEIRGSSAEQRLAVCRTRSAPLMAALKARLTKMSASSSPNRS